MQGELLKPAKSTSWVALVCVKFNFTRKIVFHTMNVFFKCSITILRTVSNGYSFLIWFLVFFGALKTQSYQQIYAYSLYKFLFYSMFAFVLHNIYHLCYHNGKCFFFNSQYLPRMCFFGLFLFCWWFSLCAYLKLTILSLKCVWFLRVYKVYLVCMNWWIWFAEHNRVSASFKH